MPGLNQKSELSECTPEALKESRPWIISTTLATLLLSCQMNIAQAQDLPPWYTKEDIIVPMQSGPDSKFTLVRDERGAVSNIPKAVKNEDGTYTLLDGRPCPPERNERQCNTANKIVLQWIIENQQKIIQQNVVIDFMWEMTKVWLGIEEMRVPWSIARATSDKKFSIPDSEIPRFKSKSEAITRLQALASRYKEYQEAAFKLDEIRGTSKGKEYIKDTEDFFKRHEKTLGLNNLIQSSLQ